MKDSCEKGGPALPEGGGAGAFPKKETEILRKETSLGQAPSEEA